MLLTKLNPKLKVTATVTRANGTIDIIDLSDAQTIVEEVSLDSDLVLTNNEEN